MNQSQHFLRRITGHAVFLAGFRPFFTLAIMAGILLPLTWALSFSGQMGFSVPGLTLLQWHAHEMFFGFGWAVLGGFLLTASKNWVKIRGLHGAPLLVAVLLWIFERVAVLYYAEIPTGLRFFAVNAFILYVSTYILWTLIYYRKQDTFKDNYFFVVALPLFISAKLMILNSELYIHGWMMVLGLFRLAFAVMFERTITQFMKNSMNVEVLRNPYLDYSVKFFILLSVFASFLPPVMASVVLLIAGGLLGLRLLFWRPLKGFSTFAIGLSYAGYFGLTVHFIFEAFRILNKLPVVGTLSLHTFTFICMGIVIPAMFIRIAQGHTGRKLQFTLSDRIGIAFMALAAVFRLVMPQVLPQNYLNWVVLAGISWALCFAVIGIRIIPFMWYPRVDGKEH